MVSEGRAKTTIVGLVGSPRRERGLTHRIVSAALEGAAEGGAETQLVYLADWPLLPCVHCGAQCFVDGRCSDSPDVNGLSDIVNAADAVVIGAPVYVWQVNGLTHAFMDRYRIPGGATLARRPNGRPALAIAVAGGTGTGVSGALRSLLDWLCLWGYRAVEPLPASRYNFRGSLEEARVRGRQLAAAAASPQPFTDLADLLVYYDGLRLSCQNHFDEMLWLAEQASTISDADAETAARLAEEARALRHSDPLGAARKAVEAFESVRGKL